MLIPTPRAWHGSTETRSVISNLCRAAAVLVSVVEWTRIWPSDLDGPVPCPALPTSCESIPELLSQPPGSSVAPPANWRQVLDQAVKRYSDHPALHGYMVRDEPGADLFAQLGRVVAELRRLDPRHPACINLFPVHASADQLQTSSYVEYLDRYLQTVRPPFLCYDHYPLLRDNTDRADFYLNLELTRDAGIRHKTPVWTVVLSGWGVHFRKPTAPELRWQVYSALAYGISGVAYFVYWPANDSYAALVDYQGRPQPLYEATSKLNQNLLLLASALRDATSMAVYHTGKSIPDGCRRLPQEMATLGVPQDLPLVIGLFESRSNERLALIVNRSYRQPVTVPVVFRGGERLKVSIVAPGAGSLDRPSERHRIELALPAGGAKLLRLQM